MNIVAITGMLAGIVGTVAQIGYFTQAYRMTKTKDSKSVSVSTYFLFASNIFVWFIYGIASKQMAIIIPNIAAAIGCLLVIMLYYKYKVSK